MTQTEVRPPASASSGAGTLDRFFQISERGSSVPREIRGGITTFVAMAYLVIVIPLILGGVKDVNGKVLDPAQMSTMVALSAGLSTVLMGVVGNAPLAMAAGLGVTPIVAFQAAPHMTWAQAMGLVVLEGVIIVILALTGIRQLMMDAIPLAIKQAIGVGIGAFIALIGLVDSGFVSHGATIVTMGTFGKLQGWPVVVFCLGFVVMLMLFVRRVPGAMLISIAATTVLSIVVNDNARIDPKSWGAVVPSLPHKAVATPDFGLLGNVLFHPQNLFGGFGKAGAVTATVVLFTLVMSGFFDAMGTIMGVTEEAGMVRPDGSLPTLGKILTVDGFGAIIGGAVSGSANTAVVESAAGVAEGARTGLASVVTGVLLGALMFFTPLAGVIPSGAATPALVIVGGLMMMHARKINWEDMEVAIPAFLTIVLMPFTYSITVGVGAGVLSFVIIKVALGKFRQIHWLLYVMSLIFIAYFSINGLESLLGVKA
jgi:AGZA family xanthine/uracil permease-like MFS transporter